jgi:hypothetical protein
MKKILTSLFFIGFISMSYAQKSVETTIRTLDSLESVAFIKQDFAILDKLWAKDMKVNNPRNTISMSAEQTGGLLKAGKIKHFSTERHIEQLFIKGKIVVVMGNEVVKETAEAQAYKRRFTNIWMKQKGEWQLTFRHANVICTP